MKAIRIETFRSSLDNLHIENVRVPDTGGDVGFTRDGGHGEFITIPANAASRKPRDLAFEQAASGHNAE